MPTLLVPYDDGSEWLVSHCEIVIPFSQMRHLNAEMLLNRIYELTARMDAIVDFRYEWGQPGLRTLDQAEQYLEEIHENKRQREESRMRVKQLRRELQKNYDRTFMAVGRRDGFHCQRCHTTFDLTIEHIIAAINGGTNALDNLQLLCKSCNSKKGDRE